MSKEKMTVSWIMPDEPLLKLKEPDETYDIQENVYKFIQDKKLHEKEDFVVEVEIDKNQGENGTITHLKEVGGSEAPKEEAKTESKEETPSEDLVVKELTVNGVSVEKKSVIFKEEDKVWYTLDDSINAQEFKDKYTRKTVEISVRQTDQGNDIVVGFTAKEEDVSKDTDKSDEPTQEKRKTNSNPMQLSIEAQASVNSANRVAQAMVTSESKPDDVKLIITTIAKHNFQTIQDLKNKE